MGRQQWADIREYQRMLEEITEVINDDGKHYPKQTLNVIESIIDAFKLAKTYTKVYEDADEMRYQYVNNNKEDKS
jgi:predicted house-cleaning noncanonical NTP pyrophosphatase (MazG superfamily)